MYSFEMQRILYGRSMCDGAAPGRRMPDRVRRGAQTHQLRRQPHAAVVAVVRDVMQRDMDGHDGVPF